MALDDELLRLRAEARLRQLEGSLGQATAPVQTPAPEPTIPTGPLQTANVPPPAVQEAQDRAINTSLIQDTAQPMQDLPLSPQEAIVRETAQQQAPALTPFQQQVPQDLNQLFGGPGQQVPQAQIQQTTPQSLDELLGEPQQPVQEPVQQAQAPVQEPIASPFAQPTAEFPPLQAQVLGQERQDVIGTGATDTLADTLLKDFVTGSPDSARRLYQGWEDFLSLTNDDFNRAVEGSVIGLKEVGLSLATKTLENMGIDISSKDPKVKRTRQVLADTITDGIERAVTTPDGLRALARNPFQVAEVVLGPGKLTGATKLLGKTGNTGKVIEKIVDGANVDKIVFNAGRNAKKMLGVDSVLGATSKIPANIAVNKVTKNVRDEFMRRADGQTIGDWLASKGVSGTLGQMSKQADDIFNQSVKGVDTELAKIPGRFKLDVAREQLNVINRKIKKEAKQVFGDDISRVASQELEQFKGLLAKSEGEGLTLSEMNKVKRKFEEVTDIFKVHSLDKKTKAAVDSLDDMRNEMKDQIEKIAAQNGLTNLAARNRETQLARLAREGLKKAEAGHKLVSGSDLVIGALTSGAADVITGLKIVAAKKTIESPLLNSTVAKAMRKMTPEGIEALESAAKSGVITPRAKVEYGKIIRALQSIGITAKLGNELTGQVKQLEEELENDRALRFSPTANLVR